MIETGSDLRSAIDVRPLRRRMTGAVLVPGMPEFERATQLWNRMVERHPRVIARVADAADTCAALAFAREHALPVSIRGGGHNVAGSAIADGGLVIDNSARRAVHVDPASRIVTAEPGVLLGELDTATAVHGLAVPVGINTTTGLAGLALGGGIGWLMRRHGLTCDHLLEVDMVLADGSQVTASETDSPDLFWGLRGGGGNFGVVTRFTLRAVEVAPEVLAGLAFFDLGEGEAVLRRYREWAGALPGSTTTIIALRTVLPSPALPAELHGRKVLAIGVCRLDPAEDDPLEREIATMGRQIGSTIRRKPLPEHQAALDRTVPPGLDYYWKSHFLSGLPDAAIDLIVNHHRRAPTAWSYSLIPQLGGAIANVADGATAYASRSAPFAININGVATAPEDRAAITDWTRELFYALEPYSTGGVYVNFLGDEGPSRVRAAYGSGYDRLATIKARFDPANVFRSNQNIVPRA